MTAEFAVSVRADAVVTGSALASLTAAAQTKVVVIPLFGDSPKMPRPSLLKVLSVIVPMLFAITGPSFAAETIFPGGTLANLQALSSTLTFDMLKITGPLRLTTGITATLKVNQLTITSSGSVGYTYGECEYLPAPDFTVQATGKVIVNGNISLIGRSGTRVLASATCNSCYGQAGGDIRIIADEITIASEIRNNGGSGSTSVSGDGSCSYGCSGGDAGGIYLNARNITLDDATVRTYGGTGGTGYCYGDQNKGAYGDHGPGALIASDLIRMSGSSVSTDGIVTLEAARTNIYGPITCSQLNETIAGNPDSQGPVVEIYSPLPSSVVTVGEPLEIRIQARDDGTGVKEIQVNGLGYSELHSAQKMVNGILTIVIEKPLPPAILEVTVNDNKGNATLASVPGLKLAGNLIVPEGETLTLIGDLEFDPKSSVSVSGTVVLKRGIKPSFKITAGSFTVTAAGIIKDEAVGPEYDYSKAPSLDLTVQGRATINGTINVSGNTGWEYYTEHGGDITIQAAGISVAGLLAAEGGWAAKSYGGKGGTITLTSSLFLNINGTISAKGANAGHATLYPLYGGKGGDIVLSYLTVANTIGATFDVSGGISSTGNRAADGLLAASYLGRPDPLNIQVVSEIEPNSSEGTAQWVLPPVRVKASVTPDDAGSIALDKDDYEDMYLLRLQTPLSIALTLDPTGADVYLDLLVTRTSSPYEILAYSLSLRPGATTQTSVNLEPGEYFILISQFGETPATGSLYTLTVQPIIGGDSDRDGLSDWWESTHFGSLSRNGGLDADNDGLADRKEQDSGTHPMISDTDGDGMPDGWEIQHRLNPLVNDAAADKDADGKTNLQEYLDGTDPNPAKSMPWLPLLLE